jgi:uracil-DNA glycosylase family 4
MTREDLTSPPSDTWQCLEEEIIGCHRCPRLVEWRETVAEEKRRAYEDWDYWGKPVPGFGDRDARLLIIGLAPGAHGSNRTGRMFTGDSSGETLFGALYRTGFANQPTATDRHDGLFLDDAFITAVARCVPPKNRPRAQELANCRPYLAREIHLLSNLEVVLALGHVAFKGYLRLLREQGHNLARVAFEHGASYQLSASLPTLVASYHPSRQNTQTGLLTLDMFDAVFEQIREILQRS